MPNQVKSLAAKFRQQHVQKRRLHSLLAALALVVTTGTILAVTQPASTLGSELICEKEEHTHSVDCYVRRLICDLEEGEAHTHTEECYTRELICEKQEHLHDDTCYHTERPEPVLPEEPQAGENQLQDVPGILRQGVPEDYTDVRRTPLPHGGAVYVFARPGVISEQTALRVQVIQPENPIFAQAQKRVQESGALYDYFTALDIALLDESGAEVEPQSPVYVSIDGGALLPREATVGSIEIQHHKELSAFGMEESQMSDVQLETVADARTVMPNGDTGSWIATFPVDGFSVYTITSAGWTNLNIKIECVDEDSKGLIETHKPADIHWNSHHTPDASFEIRFQSNNYPTIQEGRYQYLGKTYYMKDGQYQHPIYGLRREGGQWYYFTEDNKNNKTLFDPQPDFEGTDPSSTIRSVYRKIMQVPVWYLDDAGSPQRKEIPLPEQDAPGRKNPDTITYYGTVLDPSNTDLAPKCSKYFYVGKAYVEEPKEENEVYSVIREGGVAHAITTKNRKVRLSDSVPLKLMYHRVADNPDTLKTVSTREKGMTLNLFAYNPSVNNEKKLKFSDGQDPVEYNRWTGKNGGLYTGIVQPKLENGYPVMTDGGASLDYLFDPAKCKAELEKGQQNSIIKHMHTNLDHLFWRDEAGYYHYDAMTNFATIMDPAAPDGQPTHRPGQTNGGNFTVYRQPALPNVSGTGNNPKFLPFNTYAEANTPTAEPADREQTKVYHFGMTIATDFNMPSGGVVSDGHGGLTDMIFEFNGDDDVWVFIDDELVMDLGGIHDRYGGTINFRTGEVITNAPFSAHSGRRQTNLYGIPEGKNPSDEELTQIREEKGFGNLSKHNLKFFYLERGRGASNCEIRFNLVPVEHGLIIGKRLPAEMHDTVTDHMWYQFQVEAEHKGEKHPLKNATYKVIKWEPDEPDHVNGGKPIGYRTCDENGRFWLRPGERADFSGAIDLKHAGTVDQDKITIHVSEILDSDEPAPKIKAWSGNGYTPGTYLVVRDDKGKERHLSPSLYDSAENQFHTSKTETQVTRQPGPKETICQVITATGRNNQFNWVDFENDIGALAGLNITKVARNYKGSPIPDTSFAMKVELWDTKEHRWIPLPVGSDYWILEENEQPQKDTMQQLPESAKGLISIRDGQWIHMHLLPGTKYRVSEVLAAEEDGVYTTTYQGRPGTGSEVLEVEHGEGGKETGIHNQIGIAAGSQHYVTVTNRKNPVILPKGAFALTKQLAGIPQGQSASKFDFYVSTRNYQPSEGNDEFVCTAAYYNTPKDIQREGTLNEEGAWVQTITFTPDNAGEMAARLFLYAGETVVVNGLPEGYSMYVREELSDTLSGKYDVAFQEEGMEQVQGHELTTTGKIDSQGVLRVTCTNTRNLQMTNTLLISKTVKRSDQPNGEPTAADREKAFSFTVTMKHPADFMGGELPGEIQTADGEKRSIVLNFVPQGADYTAELQLKHGETLTVRGLPTDMDVVVQETGHENYVVHMNQTVRDSITVHFTSDMSHTVDCVNITGMKIPETGGHGRLPYYLAGSLLMCAGAFLLYRRRSAHGNP